MAGISHALKILLFLEPRSTWRVLYWFPVQVTVLQLKSWTEEPDLTSLLPGGLWSITEWLCYKRWAWEPRLLPSLQGLPPPPSPPADKSLSRAFQCSWQWAGGTQWASTPLAGRLRVKLAKFEASQSPVLGASGILQKCPRFPLTIHFLIVNLSSLPPTTSSLPTPFQIYLPRFESHVENVTF